MLPYSQFRGEQHTKKQQPLQISVVICPTVSLHYSTINIVYAEKTFYNNPVDCNAVMLLVVAHKTIK